MSCSNTSLLVVALAGIACTTLVGCASEVPRTPTQFSPATATDDRLIVVTKEVTVTPATGYSRKLKAGSTWIFVGRIPEGAVYKPLGDVFMLEGKHMHEANCVIVNNELVGFFLTVEQAFSPLSPHVPLSINQK